METEPENDASRRGPRSGCRSLRLIAVVLVLAMAACGGSDDAEVNELRSDDAVDWPREGAMTAASDSRAVPADAAAIPVEEDTARRAMVADEGGSNEGQGAVQPARETAVIAFEPVGVPDDSRVDMSPDEPGDAVFMPSDPMPSESPASPELPVAMEPPTLGWAAVVADRDGCTSTCDPLDILTRGKSYDLNLSVVDKAVQALVSSRMSERAQAVPDGQSLTVNLVPIFANGVSAAGGGGGVLSYPLTLRRPVPPDVSGDETPGSGGSVDWGEQAIPFVVNAFARGCAQIVVSVWNEEMTIALDGLLVTMPIKGVIGQTSCRKPGSDSERLDRPLVGSMADAVDIYAAPRVTGTGVNRIGIHVFEVSASHGDSYAVVVMHPVGGDMMVSGWRLLSPISESFRTESEFQKRVAIDRRQLSQIEGGRWAYQKTAEFIKKKLFSAEPSSQLPGMTAEETFQAIKAVIESTPDVLVSAQFFVPGGVGGSERMYLPLRMLAAPGSELIKQDFTLIEPISLPGGTDARCVGKWNVLVGPSIKKDLIAEHQDIVDRITALPATSWRAMAIDDHDGVKAFFDAGVADPAHAMEGSEGVVLVAHYGAGGIEIESNREKIDMEDIRRPFLQGSVAFLAACGTAAPNASNGLIHRMHQHNIDSFVASPLSVPTDYALILAEQLLHTIDQSYHEGATPTLQELYAQAAEATAKRYSDTNGFVGDGHQHLEYVLIGDPTIRLCPRTP